MPLSKIQTEILRLLASHRDPESYVAGATPLNREGRRYSGDIDVFHDREERVASAALDDAQALEAAGYGVRWLRQLPLVYTAEVTRQNAGTRLEWVVDSDFRFFPTMRDETFGYILHPADLAMNKVMAAAGRREVRDLVDLVEADGMKLVGALATHYHPDHIGGQMGGWGLEGISALLEIVQLPIHLQRDEVPWVERTTGVSASHLLPHDSGDIVRVGSVEIELIHTPGHTPGSQCFLVDGRLVAGDTLFLEGCGRTDLPGSDPVAMYESLTTRLARVPNEAVLFPGHQYSAEPSQSLGATRKSNYVFQPRSLSEWMTMFGGA